MYSTPTSTDTEKRNLRIPRSARLIDIQIVQCGCSFPKDGGKLSELQLTSGAVDVQV